MMRPAMIVLLAFAFHEVVMMKRYYAPWLVDGRKQLLWSQSEDTLAVLQSSKDDGETINSNHGRDGGRLLLSVGKNTTLLQQQAEEEEGPVQLQMDFMAPAYQRDEPLKVMASNLRIAIDEYNSHRAYLQSKDEATIGTFRLLVTRFSQEADMTNTTNLQQELATLSGLPLEHVIMVLAPNGEEFSRSKARNLLHDHACSLPNCLVTSLDVDMQVHASFLYNAVDIVYNEIQPPPLDKETYPKWATQLEEAYYATTTSPPEHEDGNHTSHTSVAYFPIVWSAFHPLSIELVEAHLQLPGNDKQRELLDNGKLPEFSPHRGHWRPTGTGMYVLRGMDAAKLRYDSTMQGWGGEDIDFYERAIATFRVIRQEEPGLIHTWHSKSCIFGKDVKGSRQKLVACYNARSNEDGSHLGRKLLEEKFPEQSANRWWYAHQ